jgi:low affinity Fe/Cu permease
MARGLGKNAAPAHMFALCPSSRGSIMDPEHPQSQIGRFLERISQWATRWTGSSIAFTFAFLVIVAWLISGPFFDFSNTWQLVINTGTTIVTFLMVFLIQRAQNKDALAIQLKLNEIVASMRGASNRLVDIEDLSERELETLRAHYRQLAELSKRHHDLFSSHSVDEAERRHRSKIEIGA